MLAEHPSIGATFEEGPLAGVRRLHLGRVGYQLYYRVSDEQFLDVLGLWHSSRGGAPDLGAPDASADHGSPSAG